ncbi:MAG: hypothetical protein NNA22_10770 [Nitrospira sp.]|nr:hypothetical protein [Nitrospira sp.]
MRTVFFLLFFGALLTGPVFAVEKSYYSPVIHIDVENHRILISQLGGVFYIDVPEAARPHMEKLPISGLVDFVVEIQGENEMPVLKSWKVKSGESTCMHFNGKECRDQ